MGTRKTIDGRTQSARNQRLRGASFDINGNITGGKDSLTGTAIAVPPTNRDAFRMGAPMTGGEGLAFFDRNKTAANPQVDEAKRMAFQRGQQNTLAGVRSAMKPAAAPELKVTDMRGENGPSRDGNPHGMSYLNNLSKVFLEQGAAAQAERTSGIAGDASKKGIFYAKDEAQRRAAMSMSNAVAGQNGEPEYRKRDWVPSSAKAAVLTNPKYGGTGVGYATQRTPSTASPDTMMAKAATPYRSGMIPATSTVAQERTPSLNNVTTGSGVTGISSGYRDAMKMGNGIKTDGPKLAMPELDPLKRKMAMR